MNTFYLQHGTGTTGPFRTESVQARESGRPQPRRGSVTATRFMVKWYGRWYRVYSDHTPGLVRPHFIKSRDDGRIAVDGVAP